MAEPLTRPEIMAWRRSERQRLVELRRAIPPRKRHSSAAVIADHIAELLAGSSARTISFYWPIRAEPNLLPLMHRLEAAGHRGCLPVVVEKGRPLHFRRWRDGEPLAPGVWNIPVPTREEEVIPDLLLAPVIGFDSACFRLGYGGGFFDRTLAALSSPRQVIGVGYDTASIPTIHPLPHDIPMDLIVTEAGVRRAAIPTDG